MATTERCATTHAPCISATWAGTTPIRRPRTTCRRSRPQRNTSSTWAARLRCFRRRRRISTRASTAGWPKRSSMWCSRIRTTRTAKELLADTYEQLGYQAESGPWRGVYLQGAYELRNGVPSAGGINTASPDTIKAMPPEMLFDYLAVRLNGPKAGGQEDRAQHQFHRSEEAVWPDGRERGAQLRQAAVASLTLSSR